MEDLFLNYKEYKEYARYMTIDALHNGDMYKKYLNIISNLFRNDNITMKTVESTVNSKLPSYYQLFKIDNDSGDKESILALSSKLHLYINANIFDNDLYMISYFVKDFFPNLGMDIFDEFYINYKKKKFGINTSHSGYWNNDNFKDTYSYKVETINIDIDR